MAKQPLKNRLFDFAYFPSFTASIEYLAEMLADKEEWDFSDAKEKKYKILENYLEHTYRKLRQENKIFYTEDQKFACFNTGLVTGNWEEIYALFEKYKKTRNKYTT
ncbi:MAG TPA: DUF3825 domain-containing protein [Salinivirgaceae bacterium]|nr:DUF3825 domain-containing protein [Salinivirgaceae bacterium]HQA75487.1 DUF3825 domain-containing protein [Salinivirgaceae bacterium]